MMFDHDIVYFWHWPWYSVILTLFDLGLLQFWPCVTLRLYISDIKNAIELLRSKNPKGFVQLLKSLPQIQPAPLGTESTFIVNSLGHQVAINSDGTISEDRILPNQRKVDMGSRGEIWVIKLLYTM